MTQDQEEIKIFLDELEENLNYLDDAIIALEENPQDKETLEEIFRVAHTIKGSSGFLGLTNLVNLGHAMESVFMEFFNGNIAVQKDVIDTLLECKDSISSIGKALKTGSNPDSIATDELIERVNAFLKGGAAAAAEKKPEAKKAAKKASSSESGLPDDIEIIPGSIFVRLWISPNELAPSIRAFLVHKRLSDIVEIIKQEPSEDILDSDEFTDEYDREVRFWVQADVTKEEVQKAVSVDLIEKVEVYDDQDIKTEGDSEKSAAKPVKKQAAQTQVKDEIEASDSVRIPVNRLDVLLNLVGELVIANSGFLQIQDDLKSMPELLSINKAVRDRTRDLFRISGDIQELIMKSRLVPVGQLFSRFKRFVRDYSSKTGKSIILRIAGEETEIDKKIIDEMIKPLTHIVRNSVDHGIEFPDERKSTGKSPEGTLSLEATQEGNYINIIVKDDGKGIDAEKILQKAISKGIINKEEADTYSEEEAIHLIFHPGFSTKDEVTDMSGRGIGMDVVKTSVEALNGNIIIDSKVDRGTIMTIKLPLTLAILNALIVKVGQEKFCIPMATIIETQKVERKNFLTIEGNEMVRLRDTIVPVVRLTEVFQIEPSEESYETEELALIIVDFNDSLVGLLVDEFLNRQEMVIKSLAEHFRPIEGVSGASILGDGNIILILDVQGIMKLFKDLRDKILTDRQSQVDTKKLQDDISRLKLYSAQKKSEYTEEPEAIPEDIEYEDDSVSKPKVKLYTSDKPQEPQEEIEDKNFLPEIKETKQPKGETTLVKEVETVGEGFFADEDDMGYDTFSDKSSDSEYDTDDLSDEVKSRIELAEEMQNIDSVKKLHKLFESDNFDLLKQWLLQGNSRAVQGLQQLTGNSAIKVGQSRARKLSSDKTAMLLQKLEKSTSGMVSFILPVLPLDGAIHFILTHNNAMKIVKHMLQELSLPSPEHLDLEPLMEVTNILGAAYTNSLTAVTEVMVEPGTPEIIRGTAQIKEMIEKKIASGSYSVLYIENQYLWDEEDILAELLILLPEIKVLQDKAE
ncbi:MAG: chemotaxis protein CheW [Spirochaetia bacterium]|nr:chemotaxis protein CheW [Spirochaetia bacterium]